VTSALLFLSGFAALVYQVLWMRDLAIVFGNSAHAAAVDLAVFFGGLALGAALFARFAPRLTNPLRAYGLLELGIAGSALLFFALLDAYTWIYAPLYQRLADTPALLILVKGALAAGVLGLPTVLMGATLPAMVQHDSRHPAWLYGTNTAGGTVGAFAAGFYLPPTLGFRGSYGLAVGLNVVAGVAALYLGRTTATETGHGDTETRRHSDHKNPLKASGASRLRASVVRGSEDLSLPAQTVTLLAFASGALTIGLEMAWLRMFAQVLDNSVYAFSAITVVALVAFALASMTVDRLTPRVAPAAWLSYVLVAAAVAAALQPWVFAALTGNLAQLQSDGWLEYVTQIFGMGLVSVGIPAFIFGLLFPWLLKSTRAAATAGATAGRLIAVNTAGAIAGSLATTFALLPWAGLWPTFAIVALIYGTLAVWVASMPQARSRRLGVIGLAITASVVAASSATLPRVRLDPARGERLLDVWEGTHGTVAVTEGTGGRILRLNNSYSLGGTVDRIERERIQTLIPLLLHPEPSRTFFLGLGTGITAGEATRHPVDRIVVCELVPEVVQASREYFNEWTRGLAGDPRVEIVAEDGRQYLAASDETFDVIVADLFVPWHAGTGTLYSREHFETVRSRLSHGGMFAQWLPMFQLSRHDFEVIARTFLEVFPHAVLWRGDFYANRPILALVASVDPAPLDAATLLRRARHLMPDATDEQILAGVLPFYAGNLGAARGVLGEGPINTDEHPVIEYLSPRTQWSASGASPWFVSLPLVRLFERIEAAAPTASDPYLAKLSPRERAYVEAGAFYYRAIVHRLRDENDVAERNLAEALQRLPASLQVGGPFLAIEPLVR
jgi:spermidine synthase